MVAKLSTTINKIPSLPNSSNSKIINEFLMYMKNNGSSERHQNNNLNVIIEFSNFFDSNTTFYDINRKEQILSFLDTKIKSKGLLERLIPLRSLPGQPQFDISEVVNDAGDEQFKEL